MPKTSKKSHPNRMPPGVPHPVDIHVGRRVRLRRTLLGISQQCLGSEVGLTFQQIQKYERGANRIGASRLYEFSRILDVPVSFFFDDMPGDIEVPVLPAGAGMGDRAQAPLDVDPLKQRETLLLIQAYYGIDDSRVRRRIFELARSMADEAPDDDD